MQRLRVAWTVGVAVVGLGCRDASPPTAPPPTPPSAPPAEPTERGDVPPAARPTPTVSATKAAAVSAELERQLAQVRNPNVTVRVRAVYRLAELAEDSADAARAAVPVLVELLTHADPATRGGAVRGLGEVGSARTYRTEDLQGAGNPLRGPTNVLPTLVATLTDEARSVREETPRTLGVLAEYDLPAAGQMLAAVQPLLADERAGPRAAAAEAVRHIADRLGRTRNALRKAGAPQAAARADRVPALFAPLVAPLEALGGDADEEARREAAAALQAIRALK